MLFLVGPYRDDNEALVRRCEAMEQERDEALGQLARARAALASAIAEMSGLPPQADLPWRSLHGGEPIAARFHNETDARLSLRWVSYDGREHERTTLVPGGVVELETHTAHLWRFVDDDGRIVTQAYVRADAPALSARFAGDRGDFG